MIRLKMEKVAVGGVYHFRGHITSQNGRFFRVNVTLNKNLFGKGEHRISGFVSLSGGLGNLQIIATAY